MHIMDMQVRHMLANRPGIGATGHITQAVHLSFTSLTTAMPILIFVYRGRKVISSPGRSFRVEAGEAIAVAQGQVFDFENIPADDGDYEARWLAIEPALIAEFGEPEGTAPIGSAQLIGRMGDGLGGAMRNAVDALQSDDILPDVIVRHRVTELLAWLSSGGFRFSLAVPDSYAARIRRLVGANPAHAWPGSRLCDILGVSEATLRRRLQDEGTSLREILTDVRMTHAMQLLQSSRMPISLIAASAGFESQSRFAIRFRHRFGFAPTALRGHARPGISSDRPGVRPAG